jgi:hypothetical protein
MNEHALRKLMEDKEHLETKITAYKEKGVIFIASQSEVSTVIHDMNIYDTSRKRRSKCVY